MEIVRCPESFFGKPHPWIVLAHPYYQDREDILAAVVESPLPGTLLDCVPMPDAEEDHIANHEWRLIAMDSADMILLTLDGVADSLVEFGMYAPRGNCILVGEVPDFPKKYFEHLISVYSVAQLPRARDILKYLEDQQQGE